MSIVCGMNGFGRFGLHLLSNYLHFIGDANFELKYINDDMLSIDEAYKIISSDKYVRIYNDFKITVDGDFLVFDGKHKIQYSNSAADNIPWLGKPELFLECSGKYTNADLARNFKVRNTQQVLISATSYNADQTLVYGFNHGDYNSDSDVISYGSCTVNAFIPLTYRLNELLGVRSADVNVIHNLPEHHLLDEEKNTLNRCKCTLSVMASNLLDCISDNNFYVNYTLIPYSGVSIIDYRYSLKSINKLDEIFQMLENECNSGSLKGLYNILDGDCGPEEILNSRFSSVIIKENSKVVGDSLYLHAYFDNENSANRFFDLINYISLQKSECNISKVGCSN